MSRTPIIHRVATGWSHSALPALLSLLLLLLLACAVGVAGGFVDQTGAQPADSAAPLSPHRGHWLRPPTGPPAATHSGGSGAAAAASLIDLAGARIAGAEVLQADGRSLCVRWAGPPISDSGGSQSSANRQPRPSDWEARAPLRSHPTDPLRACSPPSAPLLFSVFAEWLSADSAAGPQSSSARAADLQPPAVRSVRLCHSVRSASAATESSLDPAADSPPSSAAAAGECLIDADLLPRGVAVALRLLTECDYERWTAEAASVQLGADGDGGRPLSAPRL